MLQRMNNERDRAFQRIKELEGSLGLALQAIKRLEEKVQASETCKPRKEPKKAPIILMEDNLTKTKRALMTPKQLCPTAALVHAMENKIPGEQNTEKLAKLREILIKKTRDYSKSFPKYSVKESKK